MNQLTVIDTQSNVEAYRASTNAADLCKEIVVATAMEIQKRRYVKVEGWQAIAIAHGCAIGACDVEKVEGGVQATGEVRRMSDGQLIATGVGFVGEDEPTWYGGEMEVWDKAERRKVKKMLPKRSDYAIRAMAQTRAISRAGRSAFAHVVVMMNAGLETTPAEEVPFDGFDRDTGEILPANDGPAIDEQQFSMLQTMIEQSGTDTRAFCEHFKVPSVKALPASRFADAKTALESKLRNKTRKGN